MDRVRGYVTGAFGVPGENDNGRWVDNVYFSRNSVHK